MPETSILDFHTHAFPDALAPRALTALAATAAFCGYTPHTDGTVTGLLASMDRGGIERSVVCNIATNPRQMSKVNDFAIETLRTQPRLIPLGSLHPAASLAELEQETDRLVAAGVPGIKLHPDYVGVPLDDPAFSPILALAASRGLFVITHAGFDPISPDQLHCTPDMLLRVLADHPNLRLVAAHAGGYGREEEVLEKLCGKDIYLDTSLCAVRAARDPGQGKRCADILRHHRPDRLLFATDSPWSTPADELAFLSGVDLSESTMELLLHRNAERLL